MSCADGAVVGSRVSYEGQANPRRFGLVADVWVDRWGTWFEVVWGDGRVSSSDLRQSGWRLEVGKELS